MKQISFILALFFLSAVGYLSAGHQKSLKADFYVASYGNDRWSGKLPSANTNKSDGPFATLERARDAVRDLKKEHPNKDVVVLIRQGLYALDKTVVFGLDDSGSGNATVTYAAYPGETPVFSSGKPITNWKKMTTVPAGLPRKARGKVWVADVPRLNGTPWRFYTLYD
ncbi:MAG: right-handed parallel beta-helix repeat-containing protein, partial [Planctomycetota bacterium]